MQGHAYILLCGSNSTCIYKRMSSTNFNIVITFTQLLNILLFLIDYQKYLQKVFMPL